MELLKIKKLLDGGKSIFELSLKVVYYARVSTDKDQQLNSLDNQIKYFEQYIKSNKNWTYAGNYIDEGLSGTSVKHRKSFLKMIDDAKADRFDLIITKEISRFSRSTLDSIKYTQELLRYGVGVFFQSDNINTLLPDSELRLTIMSSIAQDEVRKLSERVKFGFKRSIEDGRVLGQNNTIGYSKVDGRLTIDDDGAKLVRRVFLEYVKGTGGLRQIAKGLEKDGILSSTGKMFTFSTLRNILTNPKYKGYYCGHKYTSLDYKYGHKTKVKMEDWVTYKDDNIPAIVSEEIWDEANELLKMRGKNFKEKNGAFQNRYTYSGKIFCGEHNTSYHRHIYKSKSGEKEVWNCKLYRLKGREDGCDSPTLYTTEIDEIMQNVYQKLFEDRDIIINELLALYETEDLDYQALISEKDIEIETIRAKKEKLLELSIDGTIDKKEFAERNNKYNTDIEKLENIKSGYKADLKIIQGNQKNGNDLKAILKKEWDNRLIKDSEFVNIVLDKIVIHKTENTNKVNMEINLKFGGKYSVSYNKTDCSILLYELGISQAQVSRLEKTALVTMRKYI